MPIRDILQLGNPMLWEKSAPVTDIDSQETGVLIEDLRDTLRAFYYANGYGRGIAAPQIGVLKRIVWIRMRPEGFCAALINPEIIWQDTARYELWDDCLSFPDLLVRVTRAVAVKVKYTDIGGFEQELRAEGDLSELLQHEIDHLDGILSIHRAVSPQSFASREEWERLYSE